MGDTEERAVKVCPQCEGEGGYPDGLDEAACHTECTRCGGNGWIVDLDAIASQAAQPAEADGVEAGVVQMLSRDHARMRKAGTALAEAALYTVREYDGLHRLSLAVADWSKALADEGDRAAAPKVPATDAGEVERLATMTRALPDGTEDNSTFEEIETALDHADAPCRSAGGRWLTLPERIAAIASQAAQPAEADGVTASEKMWRIARFMGEQTEREAIVDWLKSMGDSKPHGTDWRTYYEIAEAIDEGRHEDAAAPKVPATDAGEVEILARQRSPIVADYDENYLVARVSSDGKQVGIDHPCDAVWSDVMRAHVALRDYINERIARQNACPFKAKALATDAGGKRVMHGCEACDGEDQCTCRLLATPPAPNDDLDHSA